MITPISRLLIITPARSAIQHYGGLVPSSTRVRRKKHFAITPISRLFVYHQGIKRRIQNRLRSFSRSRINETESAVSDRVIGGTSRRKSYLRKYWSFLPSSAWHMNRVGVSPKGHTPDNWHLITDLPHLPTASVNDGTDRELC